MAFGRNILVFGTLILQPPRAGERVLVSTQRFDASQQFGTLFFLFFIFYSLIATFCSASVASRVQLRRPVTCALSGLCVLEILTMGSGTSSFSGTELETHLTAHDLHQEFRPILSGSHARRHLLLTVVSPARTYTHLPSAELSDVYEEADPSSYVDIRGASRTHAVSTSTWMIGHG